MDMINTRGLTSENTIFFTHCHILLYEHRRRLTLCDAAAKATLEAATPLYELHIRTHVGLATVATDWTTLAMVHQVWRGLTRYKKIYFSIQLFPTNMM